MKQITIQNTYENAKKSTIAFWAQRIAQNSEYAYTLSKKGEADVVAYKAMLMTDIVTLTKQGRYEVVADLKQRIEMLKALIQDNREYDISDCLAKYEAMRTVMTCLKRKPKTTAQYLEEINAILIKMNIDNDNIIKINKIIKGE